MTGDLVLRGQLVLPDRIARGAILIRNGWIADLLEDGATVPVDATIIESDDGYFAPGYIDLHVHGGAGADFMDATPEAFRAALRCHARHGTTRMAVTTTVARHEQILAVLELTRRFRGVPEPSGSRVLGAHFYGPYFRHEARGAHPAGPIRPPVEREFSAYLAYADDLVTATIAPRSRAPGSSPSRAGRAGCGRTWDIPGPRSIR
jgi:N-acetylglucosamine-6-phosphate deacetylase